MVGHADDLRLPVQDVAVRRDGHALLREAGERDAALRCQHLEGLFHGAREADELERRIDAATAGRRADRLHRIARPGIDGDRAVALRQRELRGIDVDGVDGGRAKRARELDRGDAEPADAEHRDGVAGTDARLAQCMQRGRGRAHQDRALLEGHEVGECVCVPRGNPDELGVTAVAILADHLARRAELLAAGAAVDARTAGDEVVQAHAVSGAMRRDAAADRFDDARDFMAKRERVIRTSDARTVVRIGMTDAGGFHPHEQLAGTGRRGVDLGVDQRPARLEEANGP